MTFPALSAIPAQRLQFPAKKVRMVLDRIPITKSMTVALVYALLCPEKLNVKPFMQPRL